MTSTQWDCIGKKRVEAWSRRWEVEWYVWVSEEARDDRDGILEEQTECHSRVFPNRGLAVSFGRKVEHPLMMGWPRVQEQIFEPDANGAGYGWWEGVGEWEEIE